MVLATPALDYYLPAKMIRAEDGMLIESHIEDAGEPVVMSCVICMAFGFWLSMDGFNNTPPIAGGDDWGRDDFFHACAGLLSHSAGLWLDTPCLI